MSGQVKSELRKGIFRSQDRSNQDRSSQDISSKDRLSLGPKFFYNYLTIEYFESDRNLELECGPAQPNLFIFYF